jgi:hypothetical protein
MDEVIGDLDPGQRRVERVGVEDVASDDLAADPLEVGRLRRIANQAADFVAVFAQRRREQTADIAGGTGDEDAPSRNALR